MEEITQTLHGFGLVFTAAFICKIDGKKGYRIAFLVEGRIRAIVGGKIDPGIPRFVEDLNGIIYFYNEYLIKSQPST